VETDYERVLAAKQATASRLLAVPGVHTVAIGAKQVGGYSTNELAIVVFLEKKRAASELPADELIPPELDGIKTDVVESEPIRLLSADPDKHRPLTGGIQVQLGEGIGITGTMGCLVQTNEPQPRILGITNHHVVSTSSSVTPTHLKVDHTPRTVTFGGSNTEGTLTMVEVAAAPVGTALPPGIEAFWRASDSDTPESIAAHLTTALNTPPNPAFNASVKGRTITITNTNGFIALVRKAIAFDRPDPDPSAHIRATIAGSTITFTGDPAKRHGIYTMIHFNGTRPSTGSFSRVDESMPLTSVAARVAADINAIGAAGVSASATGVAVTITGGNVIDCAIAHDIRVGQNTNTFPSWCSSCCNDRIGAVERARLDLDVALIQLDPGLKYKPQVSEYGLVRGTHTITPEEAATQTYPVRKRGIATGKSEGVVTYLAGSGPAVKVSRPSDPIKFELFHRHYDHAILIKANGSDPLTEDGDSGAVVLNAANEVVGVLFGGNATTAAATPIAAIMSPAGLNVSPVVQLAAPDMEFTVPATTGVVPFAVLPEAVTTALGSEEHPIGLIGRQMRQVEADLLATQTGQQYVALVRKHVDEVRTLVNTNRRVGAVWQRNGGPQLVQATLHMLQFPEHRLPVELNGRSVVECLTRIQHILARYASPELVRDLELLVPRLGALMQLTYPEILEALKAESGG
jgi:hypothetical protein